MKKKFDSGKISENRKSVPGRFLLFAAVCSAASLCGCKSSKPEPRQYVSVPMYMAGQEIPAESQEKYLYNSSVKMYSIGRTVDPATGTMREAGTVYRIEQAPQWNLVPQYDADHETFVKQQKQEAYGSVLAGQIATSSKQSQSLVKTMEDLRDVNATLTKEIALLDATNKKLSAELKKREKEIGTLTENQKLLQTWMQKLQSQRAGSRQNDPVPAIPAPGVPGPGVSSLPQKKDMIVPVPGTEKEPASAPAPVRKRGVK